MDRKVRKSELTRKTDLVESEIQIENRANISTDGGYQLKKCLLKARKKKGADMIFMPNSK